MTPERAGSPLTDAEGPAVPLVLALLGCLAALMPFMLSAVIRVWTGVSIHFAMLVSSMISWAAFVWFVDWAKLGRLLRRASLLEYAAGILAATALVAVCCWCLANRYVGGLSYFRGTDGSFHAHYVNQFAYETRHVYDSCTVFHMVSFWFEQLTGANRFFGFVFAFFCEVGLTAFITVTLGAHAASDAPRGRSAVALLVAMLACLVAVEWVTILPLQHLFQTDGFFPQVFALLPLFCLWAADALIPTVLARTVALFVLIVLFRYTYALNLSEVLWVFAIFCVRNRDSGERRFRRLWWVLAFGSLATGGYVFARIWRFKKMVGHFLPFDWTWASAGQALALALLFGAWLVAAPESRLRRLCRFPLLFGVLNLPLALLLRFWPPLGHYYGAKYTFHGFVLVGAAAAVAVPAAVHAASSRFPAWWGRLVSLALLGGFCVLALSWDKGFVAYHKGFHERVFASPPYTENSPLADLGALKRIPEILHKENKGFGGYLNSNFGMMMFMNAALEHPYFGWGLWFDKALYNDAGACVFWDEGPNTAWPVWEAWCGQKHIRSQMISRNDKTCMSYGSHWNPKGPPRRLCYLCK